MYKYKEKFEELKKYAQMKTAEDVKLFDSTVYELAETKDPDVLESLIDIFNDDCEFPEVMYSLVHAIETYPPELYVKTILRKIESGVKNYPLWIERLVNRIFNDNKYLIIFKKNIKLASMEGIRSLFLLMENEATHHIQIIQELKSKYNIK